MTDNPEFQPFQHQSNKLKIFKFLVAKHQDRTYCLIDCLKIYHDRNLKNDGNFFHIISRKHLTSSLI